MPVTGAGPARTFVVVFFLALGFSAFGQADVDIEKFTNGQDADTAPGPAVLVGSTVNWTYVVTNVSGRELVGISVTDDQGVVVSCPGTTLDAGLSFTCTASGTAIAGQYANIGTVTATRTDQAVVTDADPSHYFGQAAFAVSIEKRTNGFDADTPPGPVISPGSPVQWDYVITNTSSEALINIVVADDQGVVVNCPSTTLAIGASMTCTGSGIAQAGPYVNTGTVTATLAVSNAGASASDLSHYYGRGLVVVKLTNGIDVTVPPGPAVSPGSTVTWTYEVTNPGPEAVTGLVVTDDQGVSVSCPQSTLDDDETVTCTGTGIAQPGQYTNVGTATAVLPGGSSVSGSDTSYYFGDEIRIQKLTNGVDADTPPGPSIAIGAPVNWTYVITNTSSGPYTGVTVTDDQGVTVTCPDTNLAAGASMTCTASGIAVAGQYANIGMVQAQTAALATVTATNPSHYFGQLQIFDFGDAPDPTFPVLLASNGARHLLGGSVFLGACVDAEADAFASATANGDDTNAGTSFGTCAVAGDDEDGVTFSGVTRRGAAATVDVMASAPCTLSAWIDFGADGSWSEPGDALFPGGTALVAGNNSLGFTVPANAVVGSTFSRFRCTTDGAVAVTGQAGDGEVEDHPVTIADALPDVAATKTVVLLTDVDHDGQADPGDTLRYTITITNDGLGDATGVLFNDTPDANTNLVVGSVTTTTGTVTSGNTAGNTTVAVTVGTLAANGTATIAFNVTIDNPLAPGVTEVVNSGTVSGSNFPTEVTDDPSVTGSSNPTAFALAIEFEPIPTLGTWALLMLLAVLSVVALRRM
ncbi:MAG: GEVED domain-containing protein [Acidobacteriota bacterium]